MEPLQPQGRFEREPGGKRAWMLLAIGILGLALNHGLASTEGKVSLWLLLFAPLLLLFGAAGLYDRRILTGATQQASTVPRRFRVLAVVVALVALSTSAWLVLVFYGAH